MKNCLEEKKLLMESSWLEVLHEEFEKPYMKSLGNFLSEELDSKIPIYPPKELIFHAFCKTGFNQVNVVIMGQDPYHNEGQAHGLSFSVAKGVSPPPSLQNIFKELREDLKISTFPHGYLESWAEQGVLLLNATLTVRANQPKSHYGRGWETFTDRVVQLLYQRKDPLVFLLWGRSAKEKFEQVQMQKDSPHLILQAAHPSPFSAYTGFFGCKHFSKTNDFLKSVGKTPIEWSLSSAE